MTRKNKKMLKLRIDRTTKAPIRTICELLRLILHTELEKVN